MRRFLWTAALAGAAVLATSTDASAVPSFARQTGMTCNQCHVSFGAPVPNFTFTGKKFRMNGYRMPFVAEKIEAGEPGVANGKRLAIPLIPYLSFRYQSQFAAQSKAPGADEAGPITSNPTNRFSFFPGGALGDNLGLWVEVYLTPDGSPTREWTMGLFSFDEYDLRLVKITDTNTFGLSFSNQSIREVSGFGPWPTITSNLSRGGFGGWSHPNRGNLFAYGFWGDRLLTVLGASPGDDNLDWDRRNFQAQLAYALRNSDENELWFNVMTQFGNDAIPVVSNTQPNAQRTWTYTDVVSGIRETRGTTAAQQTAYLSADIGDFVRIEPELRMSFIDRGPHSMEAALRYVMARETYDDNSEAKQNNIGGAIRYMFDRTWGGDILLTKNVDFTLTDPTGVEHEIDQGFSWTAYGKYQPAMNFILMLQVGNSNRGVLRTPGTASMDAEVLKGWSWSLGADLLF
ncbi:MAG TPA: hypothetical protein VGD27_14735 [Longimicrobiales bacterium]